MTATVSTRGLTVEYVDGDSHLRPLDGFDLEAHDGELVILLGPSGSGKTTLLSCLAGLLTPTEGSVCVLGKEVTTLDAAERDRYRRDTVGVVFQAFNLLGSLTARENVAIPLWLAKRPRAESVQRATALLEQVGLGHRLTHKPAQLSGGQQQRVAIARALALDPPVLLADEPTAHLDVVQVEGVITLLRSLAAPGRTIIVSTHDERLIPLADRVVELGELAPVSESRELSVEAGEVVFEEGSRGRHVYVLVSGAVELVKTGPDGLEHLIKVVSAGTYFGEMGPLLSLPRSATARALVDSVVQQYDVRDFRHTLGTSERERLSLPT